jgi:putative membrane protein
MLFDRMLIVVGAMVVATVIAGAETTLAQPRGVLPNADRSFVLEAAEGGQMEVELGQLTQQKASSDAVRQFGRRMATDHARAGLELAQLAAAKGVELPTQPARKTQMEKDRLSKATGAAFDREYVKMMVTDHETDVAAFRRQSQQAQDPDVKAWAARTLPTLEDHLKSIKQIESQVARR